MTYCQLGKWLQVAKGKEMQLQKHDTFLDDGRHNSEEWIVDHIYHRKIASRLKYTICIKLPQKNRWGGILISNIQNGSRHISSSPNPWLFQGIASQIKKYHMNCNQLTTLAAWAYITFHRCSPISFKTWGFHMLDLYCLLINMVGNWLSQSASFVHLLHASIRETSSKEGD